MKHIKLFAAIFLAGPAVMAIPHSSAVAQQQRSEIITVKVKGLFCDLCQTKMKKAFGRIQGVKSVAVNLDTGIIRLVMAPGKTLPGDRINRIVTQTGYTPVSIARASAHNHG